MMSCVQRIMEMDHDGLSSVLQIDSDEEEDEGDLTLEGEELSKVLRMLKMTDNSKGGVLVLNEDAVQEREYQTELVRLAIKRNIIVCLPTGSGKTFIALQLTKHYLPDAMREGRKIIFLANTVMLAHQQAAYFESRLTNFCLDDEQSKIVQCLTGDFDEWRDSDWNDLFSKCHVIVMTTDILARALNLQLIQFDRIKLLVLDECHHAVGDSGMNRIMTRYRESIQDNNGQLDLNVLPRILGLTATIICGKGKCYDVEKEVEEAEKRLCAKAVTSRRYEEVLKYSTSAKVQFIYYETPKSSQRSLIKDLLDTKSQVDNFLAKMCSENDSGIRHESLRHSSQLYNKPKKLKKLKIITSCIKDVNDVYSELGLYCARWTAVHYRAFLRTALQNRIFERIDVQVKAVDTALELFISRAEKEMEYQEKELDGGRGQYHAMMNFRTDKVAKVVQNLKCYRNGQDLRGLIFMQQKTTTQALCWYLQDLSELPEFSFLKVGFVVGFNTWNKDPIEARITLNVQRDVIDGFRNGKFNLLVATSVLEEGLDVPCCNLVMRLDKIYNYPSYVQSMGRARHEQSTFLGFVAKQQDEEQYKDFQAYNERLSGHLRANALHVDDLDENGEPFCAPGEKILPDFEPIPGGARISATDAIGITQMYCQTLPCDRFATLTPEYWWKEVRDKEAKMFKAYMQFPTNAIVREVIEGEPQRSKTLAKRSVALKACQMLYEKGLLNARLLPMRKKLTEVINKFMDSLNLDTENVGKEKIGTRKRMQWYRKQIPRVLANAEIHPGMQLSAYKIHISLLNDLKGNLTRLYDFSMSEFSYCFLTTANLLEVPDFVLKVNSSVGEVKVHFEQIAFPKHHLRFNAQELVELWSFHRYIFNDLLQLNHALLKDFDGPVLVAPVKKPFGMFGHEINWDLMREVSQMPGEWFQPPEQSRQKSFTFRREDYEDAIVVPWHDPSQEVYENFHVVLNVLPETPASRFPNKLYHSYETYYTGSYPLVSFIANKTQKLLQVKKIGRNLNFFVPDVKGKKLKEPQDGSSTIELIPELTHLHPLPGSLYVQAKFLPSILQRMYRLLCAKELRELIAEGTPWEFSLARCTSVTEELASLKKRCCHDEDSPSSLQKKKRILEEDTELSQVVASLHVNRQPAACSSKSSEEKAYVLDLLHPKKLTTAVIDNMRSRMIRFRDTKGQRCAPMPITVTSYQNVIDGLTDIRNIQFKSLDKGLLYTPDEQPSSYMIMQALTMDGSQESVNLERLEMIGDSMLKYAVSRHIFSKFQDFDEGYLTEWRSSLISNRHLYKHGKKLNLSGYLAGGIFEPKCAWVPPGFSISPSLTDAMIENGVNEDIFNDVPYVEFESEEILVEHMKTKNGIKSTKKMPDNIGYAHARIGDKSIADCVEALIGAYFVSGGIGGALHVMNKIGLRGPENSNKDDAGSAGVAFGQWDAYVPVYEAKNDSVMNHLPRHGELEQLISYKFKQPWLLVEAFSHPGYKRNRTTSCYQRLEFIGDAVLDFLVTNHIYNADAGLNPGQLTDLRSALVNNVTFGSLAVRYGLHTYLLNNDKGLDDAISFFVKRQQASGHQVTGHFEILSDAECAVVKDVSCPKVLGDIWESLAGAVFIDSGMSLDVTWRVFYRLMEHEVVSFSANVPKSPVRELYEQFGSKIFRDITDTVEANQDNKPKGYRYVALNCALNAPTKDNLISVIGIGKNLTSAKLAAAKYFMKIKRSM